MAITKQTYHQTFYHVFLSDDVFAQLHGKGIHKGALS